MRKTRWWGMIRYGLFLSLSTVLIFVLAEGALRLFLGLPQGLFYFRDMDNTGLYLPNQRLQIVWAPIPYEVQTNSLGFRGPEISREKPPGVFRVIALGDSVTDGFYVENENTYPYQLEALLRDAGRKVEVVNAARGNSSIDREFEILRKYCTPLDPDLVVLCFVTNDIDDLRGKSREEIVSLHTFEFEPAAASEWLFFARTALGELILDTALKWRSEKYRLHREELNGQDPARRYEIPGGGDFSKNCQVFLEEHAKPADGIAAYQTYNDAQKAIIEKYLYGLEQANEYCKEHGRRLVFLYYPDYPEIYMPERKTDIAGILREACAAREIPFLDLTPAFQAHKDQVLHFAPLDFHPNPAGNRLIAETVAAFLLKENLIPAP